MAEFKQLQRLSFVMGLVLLGMFSPLIIGALNAHKNPEMNTPGYNYETKTFENVPCPIEIRIGMAILFSLPAAAMWIIGPIVAMAIPRMTDKAINFLFRE